MVARHMSLPYQFVCLTDQPERCEGVIFIDVARGGFAGLVGQVGAVRAGLAAGSQIIYIDLDTVIIGDLAPLGDVPHEFAILESQCRRPAITSYPCKYNSSVMTIAGGAVRFHLGAFRPAPTALMAEARSLRRSGGDRRDL